MGFFSGLVNTASDIGNAVGGLAGDLVGGVSSFLGGGSSPKPVSPPATPNPSDPNSDTAKEMQEAEDEEKNRRGEAANELTGGSSYQPQTSRAVLLGS